MKAIIQHSIKSIVLFIYLMINALGVFSQSTNQSTWFNLNGSVPAGNQVYIARDYLKLNSGFQYHPTNSNSFNGKINKELDLLIPISEDGGFQDNPNLSTRALDNSLEVGSTEGAFSVSLDGASTYTVPISLPPGTGNLVPNLSLAYNSNGENGILGEGFNLNALSAIYRVQKTIDHDHFIQEISFTSKDAFALDGNRLVLVNGTYGAVNSQYRTSLESFSLITILSTDVFGPSAFKVETKDGLTIEYGVTMDSRLVHSKIPKKIFAYYINKVTDKNGNYYCYTYTNNSESGEFRLKRIDYTGNQNSHILPYNTVYFVYETKLAEYSCSKYHLGSLQADNVLLKEIRISSEGSIFHSYIFDYSINGYTRFAHLVSIREKGSDEKEYNKTLFSWGSGKPEWGIKKLGEISGSDPYIFGNWGGNENLTKATLMKKCCTTPDGCPCYSTNSLACCADTFPNRLYHYYVKIDNNPVPINTVAVPENENYWWQPTSNYYLTGVADINGDGKDDAIYVEERVYTANPSLKDITFHAMYSTGNTGNSLSMQSANVHYYGIPSNLVFEYNLADFDGDGLADLLIYNKTYHSVGIYYTNRDSLGNVFPFEDPRSISPIPSGGEYLKVMDYNGDHLLDFTIGNYLYVSNGQNNQNRGSFQLYSPNINGVNIDFGTDMRYVADFNNDGNDDILIGNKIYYSTGNGGEFQWTQLNFYTGNWCTLGDFNGDGKVDIATYNIETIPHINSFSTNEGYFNICFNQNGSIFNKVSVNVPNLAGAAPHYPLLYTPIIANGSWSTLTNMYAADFNGDGISEIYFCTHNYDNYPSGFTGQKVHYYTENFFSLGNYFFPVNNSYFSNRDFFQNKLTGIANGLNAQTKITYNAGWFKKYATSTFPTIDHKPPVTVVKTTQQSDGIGGNILTNFTFEGAKIHLHGKGFLGFSKVIKETELTSSTSANLNLITSEIETTNIDYHAVWQFPSIMDKSSVYRVKNLANGSSDDYPMSSQSYKYGTYYYNTGNPLGDYHVFPYMTNVYSQQSYFNSNYSYCDNTVSNTDYTYSDTDLPNGNLTSEVSQLGYATTVNNYISTKTTVYQNYIQAGSWLPNKPSQVTVSQVRDGEDAETMSTIYTWNNLGKLIKETSPPGFGNPNKQLPESTQSQTKDYSYFPTGMLYQTVINSSTDNIINSFGYDTKYRYVEKSINAQGHVINIHHEPKYGNVTLSEDVNGMGTWYVYDGFGKLKSTTFPNGTSSSQSLAWINGSESGYNRLFSSIVNTDGSPRQITYFDMLGRTVGSKTFGYNDFPIYNTIYYNHYGQVVQERSQGPNGNRLVSQKTFDKLGRLIAQKEGSSEVSPDPNYANALAENIDPFLTILISNNGLSVSTNVNGKITTKSLDHTGQVQQITDPMSNTIVYQYNSSNKPVSITAANSVTVIDYDKYGRQISLQDPNAGTTLYTYNSLNQLIQQKDNKGNTYKMKYDRLGRTTLKEEIPAETGEVISYLFDYDTEQHGIGAISSMSGGPDNMTTKYKYDDFGRNYQVNENIEGETFSTTYGFDNFNRVTSITYPSGFKVKQSYDNKGNLNFIKDENDNLIWALNFNNYLNVPEVSVLGLQGQFTKTKHLSDEGLLEYDKFNTTFNTNSWTNLWNYDFEVTSGNVLSRQNVFTVNGQFSNIPATRDLTETFTYDVLDRLKTISQNNLQVMELTYSPTGNIEKKSFPEWDAQTYTYDQSPMHAVKTQAQIAEGLNPLQKITYTPFNKVAQITEWEASDANYTQVNYKYGLDNERRKSIETHYVDNQMVYSKTKLYHQNYEKETIIQNDASKMREIHYIFAPDGLASIYEIKDGVGKMYYVASDHLGSINLLVDEQGSIASDLSYDAWGRNRNPQNWSLENVTLSEITDRGYTLHEQIGKFGLINMNGRVYDPKTAQFLSPDPFIQDPDNTQSYNRYAYCLNNPLKYTDPSGYNVAFSVDGMPVYGGYGLSKWMERFFRNNLNNIVEVLDGNGNTVINNRGFDPYNVNQFDWGLDSRKLGENCYQPTYSPFERTGIYTGSNGSKTFIYNEEPFTTELLSDGTLAGGFINNEYSEGIAEVFSTAAGLYDYKGGSYIRNSDVKISFNNGADHLVNKKLVRYLDKVLKKAKSNGINSIHISCTTVHPSNKERTPHIVSHGAKGVDISSVNGVSVSVRNDYAKTLQTVIRSTFDYFENYGPFITNKIEGGSVKEKPNMRPTHLNHVHISMP